MNKPFLPSDLAHRSPLALWRRWATIQAFAASVRRTPDAAATHLYGADEGGYVLRTAVTPTSTTTGRPLMPTGIGAFLEGLRPTSAAAQLIAAGSRFELVGHYAIALPGVGADFPEPAFVAEGDPIPVKMGSFATALIGPAKKLAMLTAHANELDQYSAEAAEAIVTGLLNDAGARALDKGVFSTAAASDSRPAGILAGAAQVTPKPGGDAGAMLADLKALVAAINTAGGGARIMIFANPVQILVMSVLAPGGVGFPLVPAPSLALGTVVAVDPGAFASGFDEVPQITASTQSALHYEDTNPAPIGTAGTPNVVAAPVRSAFQQNLIALRMILRCAWTMRSGAVAHVQGATW